MNTRMAPSRIKLKRLVVPAAAALLAGGIAAMAAGPAGLTMVYASMVQGLAPSALTDTTNASNIGSGTLASGRLPVAGASAPGAVAVGVPAANSFLTGFNGSGVAQYGPASFAGLSGSLAGAQIPQPTITSFSCDGSTTAYTLGSTPTAASKVNLNIGGVVQQSASFTVSGATLTLAAACPNNTPGEAKVFP